LHKRYARSAARAHDDIVLPALGVVEHAGQGAGELSGLSPAAK
jgi:hypothetical protein